MQKTTMGIWFTVVVTLGAVVPVLGSDAKIYPATECTVTRGPGLQYYVSPKIRNESTSLVQVRCPIIRDRPGSNHLFIRVYGKDSQDPDMDFRWQATGPGH